MVQSAVVSEFAYMMETEADDLEILMARHGCDRHWVHDVGDWPGYRRSLSEAVAGKGTPLARAPDLAARPAEGLQWRPFRDRDRPALDSVLGQALGSHHNLRGSRAGTFSAFTQGATGDGGYIGHGALYD